MKHNACILPYRHRLTQGQMPTCGGWPDLGLNSHCIFCQGRCFANRTPLILLRCCFLCSYAASALLPGRGSPCQEVCIQSGLSVVELSEAEECRRNERGASSQVFAPYKHILICLWVSVCACILVHGREGMRGVLVCDLIRSWRCESIRLLWVACPTPSTLPASTPALTNPPPPLLLIPGGRYGI